MYVWCEVIRGWYDEAHEVLVPEGAIVPVHRFLYEGLLADGHIRPTEERSGPTGKRVRGKVRVRVTGPFTHNGIRFRPGDTVWLPIEIYEAYRSIDSFVEDDGGPVDRGCGKRRRTSAEKAQT